MTVVLSMVYPMALDVIYFLWYGWLEQAACCEKWNNKPIIDTGV